MTLDRREARGIPSTASDIAAAEAAAHVVLRVNARRDGEACAKPGWSARLQRGRASLSCGQRLRAEPDAGQTAPDVLFDLVDAHDLAGLERAGDGRR